MLPISRLLLKHGIFMEIKLVCLEGITFSVSKGVAGKYNRRTHRHSRIRAKMCRKRGNTFKYFCPWLLNLLNRICILLIDTLQKLYLQHTPDQDSIPASCLCRGALLDWSETVPAKCLLLSIKYGLSFQRGITAQSAKCCKHFPARHFRS